MSLFKFLARNNKYISWNEFVTRAGLYNDIVSIHNRALRKLRGEIDEY